MQLKQQKSKGNMH